MLGSGGDKIVVNPSSGSVKPNQKSVPALVIDWAWV